MAMTKQLFKNDSIILRTIEELVPEDHLVRKLEECIDLHFIEDEVEDLYSSIGRPSIPPIVLFKLIIINKVFGINSMRRTCEECKVNIAYRWYLGLSMEDKVPNYSTWSQNYIRRYKESNIFEVIFKRILKQAIEYRFVDMEAVFYDGTHQKANANKRKVEDAEVEIEAKYYRDELLKEINDIRKEHGQKEIKTLVNEELVFNEKTGEEEIARKTKHIKKSLIDSESGHYHKGEHEQCFAYTHNTCCDKNGFVIAHITTPGNVHDSSSFKEVRDKVMSEYSDKIKYESLDAGYKTPAICREIVKDGKIPLMPYKRPMTGKGLFKKYEFKYNEEKDVYICPNNEELKYAIVDKNGYKQYKSDSKKCINCPLKNKCTKSKNNQKIFTVHVWNGYIDYAEEVRHSEIWRQMYPLRKETIERIFGDCKEQHGLRFTRIRGLKKNEINATMIFACHNLKKMSIWNDRNKKKRYISALYTQNICKFFSNFLNFLKFCSKKVIYHF